MIGPNGSGKSNLLDALSFVLGLRLDKDRSRAALLTDLLHKKEGEELADVEAAGRGTAYVELVHKSADGQISRQWRSWRASVVVCADLAAAFLFLPFCPLQTSTLASVAL